MGCTSDPSDQRDQYNKYYWYVILLTQIESFVLLPIFFFRPLSVVK